MNEVTSPASTIAMLRVPSIAISKTSTRLAKTYFRSILTGFAGNGILGDVHVSNSVGRIRRVFKVFNRLVKNPHHKPFFLKPVSSFLATGTKTGVRVEPVHFKVAASRREWGHRNLHFL